MMTVKIKSWKIGQIMRDMSKYSDRYFVDVVGSEMGHHYTEYEDTQGYVEVKAVKEKESEKAVQFSFNGFTAWVPKSVIA